MESQPFFWMSCVSCLLEVFWVCTVVWKRSCGQDRVGAPLFLGTCMQAEDAEGTPQGQWNQPRPFPPLEGPVVRSRIRTTRNPCAECADPLCAASEKELPETELWVPLASGSMGWFARYSICSQSDSCFGRVAKPCQSVSSRSWPPSRCIRGCSDLPWR